MRPEMRAAIRPERESSRADYGPERVDFGSGWADFWAQKEVPLGKAKDGEIRNSEWL